MAFLSFLGEEEEELKFALWLYRISISFILVWSIFHVVVY